MPEWDELFNREEFRWKEPYGGLVEVVSKFKERGVKKIYDLGCGTGRHLVYLAKQGFSMYGADISDTGLSYTYKWLEEEGLKAELVNSDMTEILYPDEFFDVVISIFVMYHNTLDNIEKTVGEIYRVLKPKGLAFVNLNSKRDRKYGHGEEIEKDTFITSVSADAGVLHHFFDEESARELFDDFDILSIKLSERKLEGTKLHSNWDILAEKPAY